MRPTCRGRPGQPPRYGGAEGVAHRCAKHGQLVDAGQLSGSHWVVSVLGQYNWRWHALQPSLSARAASYCVLHTKNNILICEKNVGRSMGGANRTHAATVGTLCTVPGDEGMRYRREGSSAGRREAGQGGRAGT